MQKNNKLLLSLVIKTHTRIFLDISISYPLVENPFYETKIHAKLRTPFYITLKLEHIANYYQKYLENS